MECDINAIIDEYSTVIYGRVRKCIQESDVEDVTQEILLAVFRGLPKFKGKSSIGTWIYNISTHKISDWHRKNAKVTEHRYALEALNGTLVNDSAHPICADVFLSELMSRLPNAYADIIQQLYVAELTFDEIAKQEHTKYETVRSVHRRAIAYIREHELVKRI